MEKTIDVWVNRHWRNSHVLTIYKSPHDLTPVKAKLVIEIPEEKRELTRSQVLEAIDRSFTRGPLVTVEESILKNLGFKEETNAKKN